MRDAVGSSFHHGGLAASRLPAEQDVAPRFDLATEVLIVLFDERDNKRTEKVIMLSQSSAEKLCHMVLTDSIEVVICGGIEEEYYQYLAWKKVQVIDTVIGAWKSALDRFCEKGLEPGAVFK